MAKKGIRYAVFAHATVATDGTITYAEGKHISPVVGFNGAMTKTSDKDYGDDRVVDTENSVTGGTLTVELNNDEDDIYVYLLGHDKATGSSGSLITYNIDDEAPLVGVGAYGRSGRQWVAKWYSLVKFSEPDDDNSTKTENVEFGHITLEGEIMIPENGNWKFREVFETEAAAKSWIDSRAGIA